MIYVPMRKLCEIFVAFLLTTTSFLYRHLLTSSQAPLHPVVHLVRQDMPIRTCLRSLVALSLGICPTTTNSRVHPCRAMDDLARDQMDL